MKIYVASSWRNNYQPAVVQRLRKLGHEVYDFKGDGDGWGNSEGAGGFGWSEIDPNWQQWTPQEYIAALDHPRAVEGYMRDMNALRRADVCVMVNPCGQSAHAEMGFAAGAGKPTAIYVPAMREPDLMVKMAALVTTSFDAVENWLQSLVAI